MSEYFEQFNKVYSMLKIASRSNMEGSFIL